MTANTRNETTVTGCPLRLGVGKKAWLAEFGESVAKAAHYGLLAEDGHGVE
jgi:hypothetical protein